MRGAIFRGSTESVGVSSDLVGLERTRGRRGDKWEEGDAVIARAAECSAVRSRTNVPVVARREEPRAAMRSCGTERT